MRTEYLKLLLALTLTTASGLQHSSCIGVPVSSKPEDALVADAGQDADDATLHGDAHVDDARTDATAPSDAAVDDSAVDAAPNPNVIVLPPTGNTEMGGFVNGGLIVTYSDKRWPAENELDVFIFDILGRQEQQITNRTSDQSAPYTDGYEVLFNDGSFYDYLVGRYQIELYEYSIASFSETRLTDTPYIKSQPKFNNALILYRSSEGCPTPTDINLSLMDRQTLETTVVSGCEQDPETHSISEHYAAWTARPYAGHNKDIFVRDLLAGLNFRIESTDYADQFFPHTDDDHVIWMDYRDGRREIYMYTFSTGVEECLTPDPYEQAWPHLRDGIASWCDYRFSQQYGEYAPCDVYVYEIATGVGRRVTSESKTWMPRFVDSGWLLYGLRITAGQFRLYAHDLVADGILSADGHVIP
ncbi:MAG: hypothetical protein RBU30_12970 [Polyangia bacterium]|jgi:beta propeller repeat protein|nr:hypothetical protein [Polyangia bacterium]